MGIRIVMEKCLFVWKPGHFIQLASFRYFLGGRGGGEGVSSLSSLKDRF